MHAEAMRFAARALCGVQGRHVLEIGSREVNGSIRPLLEKNAASYTGIDIAAGRGVDVKANGATFVPSQPPDLVVCMETLEHTREARAIVHNAARMLTPGGHLLVTCATDPRLPHSAYDGGPLLQGEFYRNVTPGELVDWVQYAGLHVLECEVHPDRGDLYLVAGRNH